MRERESVVCVEGFLATFVVEHSVHNLCVMRSFFNPMLYHAYKQCPQCFNDVTVGHNACGDQGWRPVCCPYGFYAGVGMWIVLQLLLL